MAMDVDQLVGRLQEIQEDVEQMNCGNALRKTKNLMDSITKYGIIAWSRPKEENNESTN